MKTTTIIFIAVFAGSGAAYAADPAGAPAAQSAPATTQVAPHSHLQEKTGVQPPATSEKHNTSAMNDKSRHLHQRDAK
jgi:hypothetical protein